MPRRLTDLDDSSVVGQAIRRRRKFCGLTLVELARHVELSQPFLSQIETGRARPSLASLQRIAEALDTTPQAFFGAAIDFGSTPNLVRAEDWQPADPNPDSAESVCRVHVAGNAPFHVLEFDGLPDEFLSYFSHEGFEAAFVIEGSVEIDIDGTTTLLGPGDSISYSARLPHRLRCADKGHARVFLVETSAEARQERAPGSSEPHRPADPSPS